MPPTQAGNFRIVDAEAPRLDEVRRDAQPSRLAEAEPRLVSGQMGEGEDRGVRVAQREVHEPEDVRAAGPDSPRP